MEKVCIGRCRGIDTRLSTFSASARDYTPREEARRGCVVRVTIAIYLLVCKHRYRHRESTPAQTNIDYPRSGLPITFQ